MKKTVVKCALFSFSIFLLVHIGDTLCYLKILDDAFWYGLMILLLFFALPAYYFVKRDEERLFAYPLIMAGFSACNLVICWLLCYILTFKNVLEGWGSLVYLLSWTWIVLYFIIVIAIDLIIATVAWATHRKSKK